MRHGFKRIFNDKRGIAIENAVIFMIVIFSLCALITSFTVIGHFQVKIEKTSLLSRVELEQIGEDYLACIIEGETMSRSYENYDYEVSDDGNTLVVWRRTDEDKRALLYVEAELDAEGDVSVREWRYSLPTQTE